jgi:hypothetical protein
MKTFLLGSAAVLGFGGAAQAADLSVSYAEPVDYVRVCDAFGAGYFYIPGTDTCLRIGGYVRFQTEFASDVQHYRDWRFKGRGSMEVDAASQTDWGTLNMWMEFEANWVDGGKTDSGLEPNWVNPESMGLSIGPLAFGTGDSMFPTLNDSYTSGYHLDDGLGYGGASTKASYIQLGWAFQGLGITFRAEGPDARSSPDNDGWYASSSQGDIPDLLVQLMGEWGNVNAKVTFLYADSHPDSTWGVSGAVEMTKLLNGMDKLRLAAEYVDLGAFGGYDCISSCVPGQGWVGQLSFKHYFNSDIDIPITVQ